MEVAFFNFLHNVCAIYTQNLIMVFLNSRCGTWSLTLREEHRLRAFENRVVKKIFRPKIGRRRLHNKELNDLYSSPNIIQVIKSRRMRQAGHAACMDERKGAYMVLVGKPGGKRPLGRPTHKWQNNIRKNLQEVEWEGACTGLAWLGIGTSGRLL